MHTETPARSPCETPSPSASSRPSRRRARVPVALVAALTKALGKAPDRRALRGDLRRIREDISGIRQFRIAPDGRKVSYIRGFDLHICRLDDGRTFRLTRDDSEEVFNGELDWVYQEEIWYPEAGRPNPRVSLHLGDAGTGSVRPIEDAREDLIVRVGWPPGGERLVFMRQDREQTRLDSLLADLKSGEARTLIRETGGGGWVARLPMPRWLSNGDFLWESNRTGYRHYYRYSREGKLLHPVSKGPWNTLGLIRLDEERNLLAFYGNTEDYWIGRHAHVATLDGKSLRRITKGRGTHLVSFNHDMSLFLDTYSDLEHSPPPVAPRDLGPRAAQGDGDAPPEEGGLPEVASLQGPGRRGPRSRLRSSVETRTLGEGSSLDLHLFRAGRAEPPGRLARTFPDDLVRQTPGQRPVGDDPRNEIHESLLRAFRGSGPSRSRERDRLRRKAPALGRHLPRRDLGRKLRRIHGGLCPDPQRQVPLRHRRLGGLRLEALRHGLHRALHA